MRNITEAQNRPDGEIVAGRELRNSSTNVLFGRRTGERRVLRDGFRVKRDLRDENTDGRARVFCCLAKDAVCVIILQRKSGPEGVGPVDFRGMETNRDSERENTIVLSL